MEFLLITLVYILGVGWQILWKLQKMKKKYPQFEPSEIWKTYKKEEWNTLIGSGLGLFTVQTFWFISHRMGLNYPTWMDNWGVYVFDLFLGYGIQDILYRWLGTTEKKLNKLISDSGNT